MDAAHITHMANQIAGFFKGYGEAEALAETADHINRFWDPRMRRALLALVKDGGKGLDPLVAKAAAKVRPPGDPVSLPQAKDPKTGLPKEAQEA